MTRVAGYCPMGCGQTLFVGSEGGITCSYYRCPAPGAVDTLLNERTPFDPRASRLVEMAHAVAKHWRDHALRAENTPMAHALNCVLSALDGETDRGELGIAEPARSPSSALHVYPLNDATGHELEGTECACVPEVTFVEHSVVVVHHSLDGREVAE